MHGIKLSAKDYPGILMDVSFDKNGDLDRESFMTQGRERQAGGDRACCRRVGRQVTSSSVSTTRWQIKHMPSASRAFSDGRWRIRARRSSTTTGSRTTAFPGATCCFPCRRRSSKRRCAASPALGLRGCNVTTPHKQAIFPLLDRVDDLARKIGAVNTVVVEKDGTLTGFNNDGNGFIQSLRDADPEWRPDSGPIVWCWARAVRRARWWRASRRRAPTEIRVANRTLDKAQEIADAVGPVVKVAAMGRARRTHSTASRSSPMRRASAWPASRRSTSRSIDCRKRALVGDLIYIPPETPLLAAARMRGNITVNGLGLLLNQARPAFNAWFGVMPEITPALRQAIAATF